MGCMRDYKPMIAMFALQVTSAVASLSIRAALIRGLNPRVFVVYRQAIATLFIAPIAYFSERKSTTKSSLTVRSFCLMFLASLVGITMDQIMYFEGLRLASSSIATAMTNLVPAITFLIAAFVGFSGSILVVGGLYVVIWGKAKDIENTQREANLNPGNGSTNIANESSKKCCKIDLSEPLLVENLSEVT
ncbi:hypothetical protein HHK36_025995 [Tetracentron sinense]|uniref:WAT1-related protein n=1 Tax=Tetracentron sinense TaxID=13715 RepID=A0A834YNM3_TETSI|nr:hypothetical protein HHK36_025995 [Tetracentron sinense]